MKRRRGRYICKKRRKRKAAKEHPCRGGGVVFKQNSNYR
jgi:hypothetical protein